MARTETRSVSIDKELIKWIEEGMKAKRFRTLSDAVNEALWELKKKEEG